jgi:hypothetical protein
MEEKIHFVLRVIVVVVALTIQDSSSTMDCIAFYIVAEELVECSAVQASQNMQIEPDNQSPVLKTAIGKKNYFI